ncbi:MAG: hypothetical protein LBK95_19325 [Bifidobacteriaceae bacterium]|nr:hypothetical protein [Bifidobacteriaceae bacterium]
MPSTRGGWRSLALALVALATVTAVVWPGGSAHAWPGIEDLDDAADWHGGACHAREGVTLVVDGGAGKGGATVRCVTGAVESALEATAAAGFSYEFVPKQIGFVCQLDGYPDPCNGAPADAYWSLWTGQDGEWMYSTTGSATLPAPTDSTIGWAFGAGEPPSTAVPELREGAGGPSQTGAGAGDATGAASAVGTDGGDDSAGPGGKDDGPSADAERDGGDEPAAQSTQAPAGEGGGAAQWLDNSPVGTVIAGLLVVGAGLGAWLTARRRRGGGDGATSDR